MRRVVARVGHFYGPAPVIPLFMTHSEDDDSDLADHGTVIMDRKAASGIPRSAANLSRSRPAPPPAPPPLGAAGAVGPAVGLPTTPATPPAAPAGLPMLPPSIAGGAPSVPPAVNDSSHKRLAALVAFGSFTVVFVIGALIMILIRVARDSADDAPRPNNAVQTKPTTMTSSRGPGK